MAAPAMSQVLALDSALRKVYENAIAEFLDTIDASMNIAELREVAAAIAAKYRMLGSELGALWYDVCAELAGLDLEPAMLEDLDLEEVARSVAQAETIEEFENAFRQNIWDAMRNTGMSNVWREYERGMSGARWARVPVGETCAWCLMLASNGAWYLSEESALRESAGRYHNHCDCIAVYFADAEEIDGYDALYDYKAMYYAADQARIEGRYSEDVAERIARAREQHEKEYEAGKTTEKWTDMNATMIVMRGMYGLK